MIIARTLLGLLVGITLLPCGVAAGTASDREIRGQMIDKSRASYSGSCPCPYDLAKNGSKCGKRSAWSRPGGYAPFCYPSDISDEMVAKYRN